jgi:predicted 3-demethylubiquinone-9 3-methyltransferase (glyoxalase superfamily)
MPDQDRLPGGTISMTDQPKVRTCLWYDQQALAAAEYYCSLLPDSHIDRIGYYPEGQDMYEPGTVLLVEFTLAGTPYQALNGGPHFTLDEAVSVSISTDDQAETDRLWNALIADGGAESQCGWLKDRFGLSWQIVPKRTVELITGPEAARVWPALMQMKKIDIKRLEAAAENG